MNPVVFQGDARSSVPRDSTHSCALLTTGTTDCSELTSFLSFGYLQFLFSV